MEKRSRNIKHGHSFKGRRSRLYLIYNEMKQRCLNPNKPEYYRYGGRGIKIHQLWLDDFMNFVKDVGEPPSSLYSLDRYPDNNGNYEPSNIRWATKKEQQRNRRSNHLVTAFNETKTIAEWAERYQVPFCRIAYRLHQGWLPEDAITFPPSAKKYKTRKSI